MPCGPPSVALNQSNSAGMFVMLLLYDKSVYYDRQEFIAAKVDVK